MSTTDEKSLWYRYGVHANLDDYLADCQQDPQFYWLDPRPMLPKPQQPVPKVFAPSLPEPGGYPVAELRLFWADRAAHLVANEAAPGFQYFEYTENDPGQQEWQRLSVRIARYPVLVRIPWDYGGQFEIIEYLFNNTPVAWRLVTGSGRRDPEGQDIPHEQSSEAQ